MQKAPASQTYRDGAYRCNGNAVIDEKFLSQIERAVVSILIFKGVDPVAVESDWLWARKANCRQSNR